MNFNRTAFPKNFKIDSAAVEGPGQDCMCSLSKQVGAQFVYSLVRDFRGSSSGPESGRQDFVNMTDGRDDKGNTDKLMSHRRRTT